MLRTVPADRLAAGRDILPPNSPPAFLVSAGCPSFRVIVAVKMADGNIGLVVSIGESDLEGACLALGLALPGRPAPKAEPYSLAEYLGGIGWNAHVAPVGQQVRVEIVVPSGNDEVDAVVVRALQPWSDTHEQDRLVNDRGGLRSEPGRRVSIGLREKVGLVEAGDLLASASQDDVELDAVLKSLGARLLTAPTGEQLIVSEMVVIRPAIPSPERGAVITRCLDATGTADVAYRIVDGHYGVAFGPHLPGTLPVIHADDVAPGRLIPGDLLYTRVRDLTRLAEIVHSGGGEVVRQGGVPVTAAGLVIVRTAEAPLGPFLIKKAIRNHGAGVFAYSVAHDLTLGTGLISRGVDFGGL